MILRNCGRVMTALPGPGLLGTFVNQDQYKWTQQTHAQPSQGEKSSGLEQISAD